MPTEDYPTEEDEAAEAKAARQLRRQSDYGEDPVAAELAAADRLADRYRNPRDTAADHHA